MCHVCEGATSFLASISWLKCCWQRSPEGDAMHHKLPFCTICLSPMQAIPRSEGASSKPKPPGFAGAAVVSTVCVCISPVLDIIASCVHEGCSPMLSTASGRCCTVSLPPADSKSLCACAGGAPAAACQWAAQRSPSDRGGACPGRQVRQLDAGPCACFRREGAASAGGSGLSEQR